MKRVLVLSNNCFSNTNSNGRTLGNLFFKYEKNQVAQFYISGIPDDKYCGSYFQVTDFDALRTFFPRFKNDNIKSPKKEKNVQLKATETAPKRSVINMIIRNIVWNYGCWKHYGFFDWADSFSPEIVLIQAGDCAFMNKLAVKLSKRYNVPLVIFNTETYYFKNYNYFRDGHNLLYRLFLKNFQKSYKQMIKQKSHSIYLCDAIKDKYNSELGAGGEVIYNSSDINIGKMCSDGFPIMSYIGNIGLGRDKSLIEIGEVLQSINNNYYIDVYGNADSQIEKTLKEAKGVRFHGFISYEEALRVMEKSHILFHVESFDPFYVKDSEYGFSTKVADSILSGRVFFVYAPNTIACVQYLLKNDIGVVASSKEELENHLKKMVASIEICEKIANKQMNVGRQNHLIDNNSKKFCDLLNGL